MVTKIGWCWQNLDIGDKVDVVDQNGQMVINIFQLSLTRLVLNLRNQYTCNVANSLYWWQIRSLGDLHLSPTSLEPLSITSISYKQMEFRNVKNVCNWSKIFDGTVATYWLARNKIRKILFQPQRWYHMLLYDECSKLGSHIQRIFDHWIR